MKTKLAAVAALTAATPAMAHVEGHFHTHGAEVFLLIAALAAAGLWALSQNR